MLSSHPTLRFLVGLAAIATLGGCNAAPDEGPVQVSVIGTAEQAADPIKNLPSPASKLILETTARGLVAFDASGEIIPALAQRWIVEDEGRSYIFRLRPARWPDGTPVRASEVASLLRKRITGYRQADLSGDLAAVEDVKPMTGEVIEIRLTTPSPNFLQILAQPQLGLLGRSGGTGPYRVRRARSGAMILVAIPNTNADASDADEEVETMRQSTRIVRAERAAAAITRFKREDAGLVVGGRYQHWPILAVADIRGPAVRIDPVQGLFGLAIIDNSPFLLQRALREAISMTIDREALTQRMGIPNWTPMTRLLPLRMDLSRPPIEPAWTALTVLERRTRAAERVARWRAAGRDVPVLRVALPPGPGSRLLFASIATDLRAIGLSSIRVDMDASADLELIDEVAPYDSALWYLGRIGCGRGISCDAAADHAVRSAASLSDRAGRAERLADAEILATAYTGFIPLASPLRWSLVAPWLGAYQNNVRARHPLNQLIADTK